MTANAKWAMIGSTLLMWAIGCCVYCYWYITSILAPPFEGDAYANSTGFQFIAFVLLRFPFLLLALFPILYIAATICDVFLDKKKS